MPVAHGKCLRRDERLHLLDVAVERISERAVCEDELGEAVPRLVELLRAADEIGLAVQLDERGRAALDLVADEPLGGHAARLLRGGGEPLLAKDLLGLVDVAVRLLERALAVEHSGARLVAEHP